MCVCVCMCVHQSNNITTANSTKIDKSNIAKRYNITIIQEKDLPSNPKMSATRIKSNQAPRLGWLLFVGVVVAWAAVLASQQQVVDASDDKIKDLIKSLGMVEMRLIEARVPDLDPFPMQKDSDVFVRVYLNDTKELVCETPIIQDENHPQFNKECKLDKAVPADTVLRIELYDSDKPAVEPDWIGMSKIKISDLILNRKLDSKESFPIEGRQFPKYFIKAKIDFKPQK